jgi:hypothetical protein
MKVAGRRPSQQRRTLTCPTSPWSGVHLAGNRAVLARDSRGVECVLGVFLWAFLAVRIHIMDTTSSSITTLDYN